MASKKDKFGKKVRGQLRRNLGQPAGEEPETPKTMQDFVDQMESDREEATHSEKAQEAVSNSEQTEQLAADNPESRAEIEPQKESPSKKDSRKSSYKKQSTADQKKVDPKQAQSDPEIDLPSEQAVERSRDRTPRKVERVMPRSRDSIYNVSSDIRLDDYTEDQGGSDNLSSIARIVGGLILVSLLGWGIYNAGGALFAPSYQLGISNSEITDAAMVSMIEKEAFLVSSARPVYIRFGWEDGQLNTDYLRISIYQAAGTGELVAEKGRTIPVTVNYIMFAGHIASGRYRLVVEDRGGSELLEREFQVR